MSARLKEAEPRYIGAAYLDQLRERLSERDWAVIESLARVRCLSGAQLERLHFATLSQRTRPRTRRAVLARLASWRIVTALERRIGGVRGGSAGLVFTLDTAGQRLLDQRRADRGGHSGRPRRPTTPGQLFVRHTLAVSGLYVSLAEAARRGSFQLARFDTEPVCWWPNGLGGRLKPDAYVALDGDEVTDYWWCEIDLATESLPTVKRKLTSYLDFARRRQRGPDDVLPRVLITTQTDARLVALCRLIGSLPHPAATLFRATQHEDAAAYLGKVLRE